MPRELREVRSSHIQAYTGILGPSGHIFVPKGLEEMKVVGAWAIWLVLRQLQWILGPKRRCSGHWFVQFGAMAAYYLPTPVLFYAASTGNRLTSDNKLWVNVCSMSLLFTSFLGPVVMTTYSLNDSPFQRWRFLPWLPYIFWLEAGYIWRRQGLSRSFKVWFVSAYAILPLLMFVKPPSAAKDLELEYLAKEFADYMTLESRSALPFFDVDANSISIPHNGCKYPFMQKDFQWITIKDLLQCDQLPEYCTVDARDLCLSYSFCHLLERRYFGFHCAEEGNAEVRNFVLTKLLSNYKRAFTIVEVQLAFLHDHFFTVYRSNIPFSFPSFNEVTLVMILQLVACQVMGAIANLFCGLKYDVYNYVTPVAMYPLLVLITLPKLCPVLPKYWGPIWNAFINYPPDTGRAFYCYPAIARYIRRSQSWNWSQKSYWRNKIGQYSLIEDYDRRSSFKESFVAWIQDVLLSKVSHSFIKHHPVKEENIRVPDNVTESVALVLQGMNGPPTNGSLCLQRNTDIEFDDLAWTLRQETHTHTILIWHIATCYCDMFFPPVGTTASDHVSLQKNHEVATSLSRYCAYLVAFLPEFLPEHSLNTMVLLQQVLEEAKDLLGKTRKSMEEKLMKIQGLPPLLESDDNLNTFQKGVKVGRQLTELGTSVRWKVMAEFWAETILYVAPSDNAAAHVERLAKGGEFVTHLWAMLSNAGILKRATEEWSPSQQHEPTVCDSVISLEDHQGRRNSAPIASVSDTVREGLRLRRTNSLPTL